MIVETNIKNYWVYHIKYGLKVDCSECSQENLCLLAKISDQIHFYPLETFHKAMVGEEMGMEEVLKLVTDRRLCSGFNVTIFVIGDLRDGTYGF